MPNGGVRRRILGNSNGLAVRGLALLFGFLFCGFSENGWWCVLEHEGLGEMCVARVGGLAVQNSLLISDGERTHAAGTRHHPIQSYQSTHLILPYLSIIKASMGILQFLVLLSVGGASIAATVLLAAGQKRRWLTIVADRRSVGHVAVRSDGQTIWTSSGYC